MPIMQRPYPRTGSTHSERSMRLVAPSAMLSLPGGLQVRVLGLLLRLLPRLVEDPGRLGLRRLAAPLLERLLRLRVASGSGGRRAYVLAVTGFCQEHDPASC